MDEQMRLLVQRSAAAAAMVAGVSVLVGSWPWRRPRAGLVAAGCGVGIAVGVLLGAKILDIVPRLVPPGKEDTLIWGFIPRSLPPEDKDRLLLVVLPGAALAEIVAALLRRRAWLKWLPRALVAAAAGRILLHGSTDLTEAEQPWLILGGLAAALAAEWFLLDRLAGRQAQRSVTFSLAFAVGAAGVTIMLSGYAFGGLLGFPIAAALAGVALASLALKGDVDVRSAVGIGAVGLFSLLVAGHYFGMLTATNALLLFVAPLLGWLPELVPARFAGPTIRGGLRLLLVAGLLAVPLKLAWQKFNEDSASPSSGPDASEPSRNDYMNFGK